MRFELHRREFITLIGGAAVAWPLAARAQQPKVPTIGALVIGNINPEMFWREFRQGLRDLGYVEGQNIRFEFRSAEGHLDRLPELAAELVRGSHPPLWRQSKRRTKSRSSWPSPEIPLVRG
jgi:putative ABC transport system substrate-binding protein